VWRVAVEEKGGSLWSPKVHWALARPQLWGALTQRLIRRRRGSLFTAEWWPLQDSGQECDLEFTLPHFIFENPTHLMKFK
jgi:hypothetical protein